MPENQHHGPRHALHRRGLVAAMGAIGLGAPFIRHAQAATSGLVVIGKEGWLFPLWDSMSRFEQSQLRSVTQVINDAVGLLKTTGIDVVIAMIPSKVRTYRQYLPEDAKFVAETDKRYPAALAELRRPGTLVPDLDAVFRATRTAQPALQLYFKTDTHWMPNGAELAAGEIAKRMAESLRLPASPRPGIRLGAAAPVTNPVGDLVRWVSTADRPNYPAEQYQIRQAVSTGPAALLDDDTADVLVVGNSFVQPKYGFQPTLSSLLGRPIALAWKPNNYGPFYTLLEHVKTAAFRKQKPKVLVWTHLEADMQNMPSSSSWGQNAMPPQTFLAELKQALGT